MRLVLVMVGLPARGKTTIARKLARYLRWRGTRARVFNVGSYRRERLGSGQPATFFDPTNPEGAKARRDMALAALDDVFGWLDEAGGVALYDATNGTRARREMVLQRCAARGLQVVFVESVCNDPEIVEQNVRQNKIHSPDYAGADPEQAVADFRARIAFYESAYEPLGEAERDQSWIKLVDVGRQVVVNRIEGWLPSRLVPYLMNLHIQPRVIWLTRHGQSEFNVVGRIGGDSPLTDRGRAYARKLSQFLEDRIDGLPRVWTSTLNRAVSTASQLPWPHESLRALDEIDAGVCDGWTYDEVQARLPDEFAARKADKLRYRYPRGESYQDVFTRLNPMILELERVREPLIVVAHQAILRGLYAYLVGTPQEDCPYLSVPLHTVVELRPRTYGVDERRHTLMD